MFNILSIEEWVICVIIVSGIVLSIIVGKIRDLIVVKNVLGLFDCYVLININFVLVLI